jgi:cell division protein FtsL|tara:strand:- start:4653 stop:4787 length:135 start_codon:yes stop_codon:yes gene_type:complete
MNKLVLKILVSFVISFFVFLIYLGTTDFVVKPKIIESDYQVDKK